MKPIQLNSVLYNPGTVPSDVNDLSRYLTAELPKIQNAINILAQGHVDTSYAAPTKPRIGDLRLADGTKWNPGSGRGFYGYYGAYASNASWHFLG